MPAIVAAFDEFLELSLPIGLYYIFDAACICF
jgi:hypothetical protein